MIQALDNVINVKTKLTVDIINALLLRNFTPSQIAKTCNVTPAAVTLFIKRHYDQIIPVSGNNTTLITAKTKRIVNQGLDQINNILAVNVFDKRDLVSLSTCTGTIYDKMRLEEGKSTQNIDMHTNDSNIKELDQDIEADEARLAKLLSE